MVQVPRAIALTVPDETVQILGVLLATVTARPDEAEAEKLCGIELTTTLLRPESVMD